MQKQNLIPWLYLSLGIAQAAHSVEEILTSLWKNMPIVTGSIHNRYPFFPVFGWSAEGFAAANIIIVSIILALSPFVFLKQSWAWKIVRIVSVIEILNGVIHIVPAMIKGGYYSGCISAVFLLILGTLIMTRMGRPHGKKAI